MKTFGYFVALLLLSVFSGLTSIFFGNSAQAEILTIERLHDSPALSGPTAKRVEISPDGTRVTFLRGKESDKNQQDLWEYNIASGETHMLVDSLALVANETLDEAELARRERQRIYASGIVEYKFSPDGRALLFPLGGDLYYLPIGGDVRQLTASDATETDAKISPLGNYVSYVRDQNLYIIDLETGLERAITTEGGGAISYAMADFAAQEEMGRLTGYWWAKDDSKLAFTRTDESEVILMDRYEIGADGSVVTVKQRYPFAGTANAVVELAVMDLSSGQLIWMDLGDEPDIYIPRVNWSPDGTLAVQRQSRDQRVIDLIFFDVATGQGQVALEERQDNFTNIHSDLHFIAGGQQFLWTSEATGYRHIYLYNKDGSLVRQLTSGEWMVAATGRTGGGIRAVNEETGFVYFEGWLTDPRQRHLYHVPLAGGDISRMTEAGGWHTTKVAPDGSFFIDSGESPTRPPYTAIRSMDGTLLSYISENALDESHPYFAYLENHLKREFGSFEADDGTTLYYQITKPADFDETKEYPAIVYLYGGPGVGQQVRMVWQAGLNQILAQNGYVVFTMDNRGSPNRGKAFEDVLFRNMGDYEVRDQITGTNWLKSLPYVDGARVGIYGWSYGGYMTLMMMLKNPGVFAAGIAGAPVTDWRLYDTHYTERYMGDPNDGDNAYAVSSPMSYVDNLADPLLVIHGMADDNVFFNNSVALIGALQRARKPFDLMTYPGKTHRITGMDEQIHRDQMRLDFFDEHLKD
jgi:dipeptidyl-peptidase 4